MKAIETAKRVVKNVKVRDLVSIAALPIAMPIIQLSMLHRLVRSAAHRPVDGE